MALGKNAISFYILGIIRGMSTSLFSIVPITMIINGWFEKKHGLATSIAFGFSGLGGTLCSPVLSSIISSFNWQMGYLLKAVILLLLCLPAVLYPFSMNAKDEGLLPYGYQEKQETAQNQTTSSFHFMSVSFISFFIFGMLISCITSVTQHLPGYGESLGFPLTSCAILLSSGMMGNIVSKLVIGSLSDHFGEIKATLMMITVNILGIVLLIIGRSMTLLIIGAFLSNISLRLKIMQGHFQRFLLLLMLGLPFHYQWLVIFMISLVLIFMPLSSLLL